MTIVHAKLKRWSIQDYERLAELGMFSSGPRVELLEGEITEMSPQNVPHSRTVSHLNTLLVGGFGSTHSVRVQLPLNLGPGSQLEPDFALVPLAWDSDVAHPSQADLVIEVSDSSLAFDRGEKSWVYARAGIPEYWIVNLKLKQLEVYRQPGVSAESPLGYAYHWRQVLDPSGQVQPLVAPSPTIEVRRLSPYFV